MSLLHPGLEAFVAVVRQATVHGAAREIGLTQTGVTQRIKVLEGHLGTTLFLRSRKGMQLTQEGQALYRYCQRAMDLEGEFLSLVSKTDTNQPLRINITGPSSMMRSRIIPGATSILSRYKKIVFTFNLDDDRSGLTYLKSGQSQLAIVGREEIVSELDSKLLKPALYVLVASSAWKDREIKDILVKERIVDFNDQDHTTYQYLKKFRLVDLVQKERHLANNTDALAALVAGGYGYSVLSTDFAKPLIERGSLIEINPGKSLRIDFALAWYPRPQMPDYFKKLVSGIK